MGWFASAHKDMSKSEPLVPMNVKLFGKIFFADLINLWRLRWDRVDLGWGEGLNPMTVVFIRRWKTQMQREEDHVSPEAETGVLHCKPRNGKDGPQPPEAKREARKGSSLRAFWGNQFYWHLDFGPLASITVK